MIKIIPAVSRISVTVSIATILTASQGANAQSGSNDIGFADINICNPGTIDLPQSLVDAPTGNYDEQPTSIEGDEIQTEDGNTIKLLGNAFVVQGDRGVFADEINFNNDTYQAGAKGNVKFFTGNGDEIGAESLELEVDTFIGTANNATIRFADNNPYITAREHYGFTEDYSIFAPFRNKIVVTEDEETVDGENVDGEKVPVLDPNIYVRARAKAETMDFEGKEFQTLYNATLTTCNEANNSVLLSAKQIELDHVEGIGSAKNMTVKFKKVPIFYFPSVTFPINDERKTGFLFPSVGYEDESGTILGVPYYINIGPQHDATVTPRLLSKRGVQLYGEYRYLTEKGRGDIKGEYLPGDDVFGDDRYAISFFHEHKFNQNWEADVDLQDVSDTSYLSDFSSDVDVRSSTYIPQNATLDYFGDKLRFSARASAYERVNEDVSVSGQPYERLPQVTLNLREQQFNLFAFGVDSEFTEYRHDDNTRVDGSRLLIKPYIGMPLDEIYGFLKPKISFQSISYSLNNNPTGDDSPGDVIPIGSIDSGLFFERLIKRPSSTYVQTLEPRLFYVNIPQELDQQLFPDFDTGGGSTSSFSHFFRENRFFGGDRVGDTEQLSLGLTSKIIDDDTGLQRLNVSLGQVFYFEDRLVTLSPDDDPDTEDTSDFLAEVTAGLSDDWNLRAFGRWTAEETELEFLSFSADYFHSSRRNASISYSRTLDTSDLVPSNDDEQLNLRIGLPMGERWQLDARTDYSIEDSELRTAEIGLVYDACCWALGLVAQRYRDDGDFKDRFLVTFELDDLGRISTGL